MIIALTKKVEAGDIPPLVKEWVDECTAYWAKHGYSARKQDLFTLCINDQPADPTLKSHQTVITWEVVKLKAALFGGGILANSRILELATKENMNLKYNTAKTMSCPIFFLLLIRRLFSCASRPSSTLLTIGFEGFLSNLLSKMFPLSGTPPVCCR